MVILKMFENINFTYFIISFCIGIMFIYIVKPQPIVVNKFPSPDNMGVKYRDSTNNCYKYEYDEVQCTHTATPQSIIEEYKKN